ncbi:hypothetical protein LJR039_000701 [Pseudorhodoferax sp. LjRoot39]|uniref:protein NO VEIN domain-containing protein n=1 Tax=Pseudorhodoferax sp. LjRoot39 TaxID=3342328 RepID=UPI003ECC92F1
MDKEVAPAVLAVINEKRLSGDKRTPVEIITKMGVFDARDKASDMAWLASGDNIIVTIWAELVSVGEGGRWFLLESLDPLHRIGGGERTELRIQRTKDRIQLIKRALDADQGLRAVLQTNRVAIADLETDKAARMSVRVPDEQEWHVAVWSPEQRHVVLVRGPRGWVPNEAEIQAARARAGIVDAAPDAAAIAVGGGDLQSAALDHLTRHFAGYGYKTEMLETPNPGYAAEVRDKKGKTLLKLVVKGTATGATGYALTAEERAFARRDPQWRLAVVSDVGSPAAQHKLYNGADMDKAPGLAPELG